ncbi:hypothetical protein LIER_06096 [Lithospermum erythrorhizon]|uniref:Uncharacterized protein n=1 Tax=Lithospermum erythrorhizon TaxID=34254 RepID=A0AAV3P314_LITER
MLTSPFVFITNLLSCLLAVHEAPCSTSVKHGKRKGLHAGVRPSTLIFQLSGPSKRKHSSSSTVEDRDPKHARGARKDISSSRGSRVASPVCKSLEAVTPSSPIEHIELVDTGGSPECLAIEVAKSHLPAPPALSIAQEQRPSSVQGVPVSGLVYGMIFKENLPIWVSLEHQASRKQCEVQKIAKLEQEVVKLETRVRDLHVQIQEQKSVISELDLGTANTFGQIDILENEILSRAGQPSGTSVGKLRSC